MKITAKYTGQYLKPNKEILSGLKIDSISAKIQNYRKTWALNPTSSPFRNADFSLSYTTYVNDYHIPFDKLQKPELLMLVKSSHYRKVCVTDPLLKRQGHKVLHLLPYHWDLNPIELV